MKKEDLMIGDWVIQRGVPEEPNYNMKEAFLKDFADLCKKYSLEKVYWMEDYKAKTSTSAYHICALYLSNGQEINSAELLDVMNIKR